MEISNSEKLFIRHNDAVRKLQRVSGIVQNPMDINNDMYSQFLEERDEAISAYIDIIDSVTASVRFAATAVEIGSKEDTDEWMRNPTVDLLNIGSEALVDPVSIVPEDCYLYDILYHAESDDYIIILKKFVGRKYVYYAMPLEESDVSK